MEHWGSQQSVTLESSCLLDYLPLEARAPGLALHTGLVGCCKEYSRPFLHEERQWST